MPKVDLLSTGDAARLLKISRSTISRKFDAGVLRGQVNPITGERQISRESIVAFLKDHNLRVNENLMDNRQVLLGTADKTLVPEVEASLAGEIKTGLSIVGNGMEAVLSCTDNPPSLFIIDASMPGISIADVLTLLRNRADMAGLKILCLTDEEDYQSYLRWGSDEVLARKDADRDTLSQIIKRMLGEDGSEDEFRDGYAHQRKYPRHEVNIPASISIYRTRAPRHKTYGHAVVRDISRRGAYLTGLQVEGNSLPAESFRMVLEIDTRPLENWSAHCQVVRLKANGALTIGLHFIKVSKANQDKLDQMLDQILDA